MKRVVLACAAAAFAACAALSACGSQDYYGQANLSEQAGDPRALLNVNVGVWIPEGSAASAHIDLVGVNGTSYAGDLQSKDPGVLGVLHTPGDPGKYVFLGTSRGTAEIVISVNGVPVRSVVGVVEGPEDAGPEVDAGGEDAGNGAETGGGDAEAVDAGDAGPD